VAMGTKSANRCNPATKLMTVPAASAASACNEALSNRQLLAQKCQQSSLSTRLWRRPCEGDLGKLQLVPVCGGVQRSREAQRECGRTVDSIHGGIAQQRQASSNGSAGKFSTRHCAKGVFGRLSNS